MIQPFDNNITLLERQYVRQENDLARVLIGQLEVIVPDHPFWNKFALDWEPDTARIYESIVKPDSTVLDIGAWIGPTMLFALACGATNIIALEPNAQSYSAIKKIIELNPEIAKKVTLLNQAVSDTPGVLKMGLAEGEDDTSTFGLQGDEFEIQTTTIDILIQDYDLESIDLIKIDIEGAEVLLSEALSKLGQKSGQNIHLSIHVPFFPETAEKNGFAHALNHFTIFDDRGEQLSHQVLIDRILSDEPRPEWGTKHGNFFEVFLVAK